MTRNPNNTVELTAIFRHERTFKNDGTPQRWIVGEAAVKEGARTKYITITGECQKDDLRPNVEYRFAGRWKTHPKFGTSFAFDSFAQPEPITREAIVGYLTQASLANESSGRMPITTINFPKCGK